MSTAREIDPVRDLDLQAALERGGERSLAHPLASPCACGHPRRDHVAATGALGGFGGSACDRCWTCGTYRPANAEQAAHLSAALERDRRRKRCLRARLADGREMVLDDYLFGDPEGQLVEFRADVDEPASRLLAVCVVGGYDADDDVWLMRDETPVEVDQRVAKVTAGLMPRTAS